MPGLTTNSALLLGVVLDPSKWVQMHWSGQRATLTLIHLNKEDEGLYTLRINTKSGFDSHSAYVFVRGKVYYNIALTTIFYRAPVKGVLSTYKCKVKHNKWF